LALQLKLPHILFASQFAEHNVSRKETSENGNSIPVEQVGVTWAIQSGPCCAFGPDHPPLAPVFAAKWQRKALA